MTALHVTIAILLIAAAIGAAGIAGLYITGHQQRLRYWSDDDIAPPDWINHGREDRCD